MIYFAVVERFSSIGADRPYNTTTIVANTQEEFDQKLDEQQASTLNGSLMEMKVSYGTVTHQDTFQKEWVKKSSEKETATEKATAIAI